MTANANDPDHRPARLILEDGTEAPGRAFGAATETIAELVFNTSMTGYQEILTDPSYSGQTVLLTQPHIGNYGVNSEDEESHRIWASGLIVREACGRGSNFRSGGELGDYLKQHDIPGMDQVDTRSLTRRVRDRGAMRILMTEDLDTPAADLTARVLKAPTTSDVDHVDRVSRAETEEWTRGYESPFSPEIGSDPASADKTADQAAPEGARPRIVAYDLGIKRNILRSLVQHGFDVTLVPANTPAAAVMELAPAGVFLSNGPGDPAVVGYVVKAIGDLVGKVPIFGICLGHQILAQVFGAKTFKMKFGHHGGNQPVIDLKTEKVEITAQNHSFAVDPENLPPAVQVTHLNLNDNTVEGLEHKELPIFSVQYHPEAAPGPHDSLYLFDRFKRLIAK